MMISIICTYPTLSSDNCFLRHPQKNAAATSQIQPLVLNMHAAYSTMLRHIRHREDAYQAILRSINCLTTTEKALPSLWKWELIG